MLYFLIAAIIIVGTLVAMVSARQTFGALVAGVTAVAAWTMFCIINTVPAGYVGLVYRFGDIVGQRGSGLQYVAPWESVSAASVQILGHKFPKLDSFSLESQDVFVSATINTQVSPTAIQGLYRDVGCGG